MRNLPSGCNKVTKKKCSGVTVDNSFLRMIQSYSDRFQATDFETGLFFKLLQERTLDLLPRLGLEARDSVTFKKMTKERFIRKDFGCAETTYMREASMDIVWYFKEVILPEKGMKGIIVHSHLTIDVDPTTNVVHWKVLEKKGEEHDVLPVLTHPTQHEVHEAVDSICSLFFGSV